MLITCSSRDNLKSQTIELKNQFYYINGEKFFIKGIGYEVGAAPGELPWTHTFDPDRLHADMQRISGAGFNTIRTWSAFSREELEVISQYDIKIIMGIWIDPEGDFSDPSFAASAQDIVRNVLSYSKDFDNIIGYLIMNEPLPAAIFTAGYDQTRSLWSTIIDIIHNQHPGRPVSIANTCVGTFIDPEIFDFSAYNVYIYNPVTVNFLHHYRAYVRYLQSLRTDDKPLVITEYGLSVSPSGPGNWGYGGNTLQEQEDGILHMYQALVNGGAAGSCIFNYSDGWWKAGDEYTHDDAAEEWFGLIEYTSFSDDRGITRPVWDAVKAFQSAIITEPQSGEDYTSRVPVEVFLNDTIKRLTITHNNSIIYDKNIVNQHLSDTLDFSFPDMQDLTLVFQAYDQNDNLIKSEEKNILVSPSKINWPAIEVSLNNDYRTTGQLNVTYNISKGEAFQISNNLDYIYYPHIGFNYGQNFTTPMPSGNPATFSVQHPFDPSTDVFTVGAAFDVYLNNFHRRIVGETTHYRGEDTGNFIFQPKSTIRKIQIYPNPAETYIKLWMPNPESSTFSAEIFNNKGELVMIIKNNKWNSPLNISQLAPGIYYLMIHTNREDYSTGLFFKTE